MSEIVRDRRLSRIRRLSGIGDCLGFGDGPLSETVLGQRLSTVGDYPWSETVQGLLNKAVFQIPSK